MGNITHGRYQYLGDLLALEATGTGLGPSNFIPATPLSFPAWEDSLRAHPDKLFVNYIMSGIKSGFHIGADRSLLQLKKGPGNMSSVRQQPRMVETHIAEEVRTRHLIGPLPAHLVPFCHSSPIGLIPKPHHPGKWRLIVDLSSPRGSSVNDCILCFCTECCRHD